MRSEAKVTGRAGSIVFFYDVLGVGSFSNFLLIAVAVLCCGAFGGTMASVRAARSKSTAPSDGSTAPSDGFWWGVIKGFSIGFAVYLFIRSGNVSYFGDPLLAEFNPISGCFFAMLCGLFFDRAVSLLETLFDTISDIIKKQTSPAGSGQPAPDPTKPAAPDPTKPAAPDPAKPAAPDPAKPAAPDPTTE
jgi:hypothetical protein